VITVDFKRLFRSDPGGLSTGRILDIGCGTGRHMTAAFRYPKAMVVGADINLDEALAAKDRLNTHQKQGDHRCGGGEICVADICALPFRDNFFDIVVCSEVLEHIQYHQTAVSEIARVLKPGKNLVVSVPRYLPERICWVLSEDYRNTRNGHVRIYSKNALVHLLKNSGLKKWGLHFAHSLHTPYWWLKCLVGPDREDCKLVNQYHRFLVWDMMKKPWITQFLDKILNPVLGKSIVLYLRKENIKYVRHKGTKVIWRAF
jgi:SAM-dependent methyltransferase